MSTFRPFEVHERVRWADVDLIGIMRFSAVPRFVEMAEQELMRAAGLPFSTLFAAPDLLLPRRHLSIDYLAPARLDDLLRIEISVAGFGETSLTFFVQLLLPDGGIVAEATLVLACVSAADFTKRRLPDALRTMLGPWVRSTEVSSV